MKLFPNKIIAPCCFTLLVVGTAAHAQNTYYPVNTVINKAVNTNGVIGYANDFDFTSKPPRNPTSPTVTLIASGSIAGNLGVYNSSTLNTSGVIVGSLFALSSSTVNFLGGSVPTFNAVTNSISNVKNGSINNLNARNNARVTVTGGKVNGISAEDTSVVNLSGGVISRDLAAQNNGTVNFTGGVVQRQIFILDNGAINFFGTGFTVDLYNPDDNGLSDYLISGTLANGTVLNNNQLSVQNGTGAKFTLNPIPTAVPEPGSVALLAGMMTVGAGVLRKRRK